MKISLSISFEILVKLSMRLILCFCCPALDTGHLATHCILPHVVLKYLLLDCVVLLFKTAHIYAPSPPLHCQQLRDMHSALFFLSPQHPA